MADTERIQTGATPTRGFRRRARHAQDETQHGQEMEEAAEHMLPLANILRRPVEHRMHNHSLPPRSQPPNLASVNLETEEG